MRARIHVIGHIGVVGRRAIDAIDTNLNLAIADSLHGAWREKAIERDEGARASSRITGIFRARLQIIARFVRAAFDGAHAHQAASGRHPYSARRVVNDRRIDHRATRAAIGRARLAVILDVRVVIDRNEIATRAIIAPTIPRNLSRQRGVGHICTVTRTVRKTRVGSARVAVVAVRIVDAGRGRLRRSGAELLERARGNLCNDCRSGKQRYDSGEESRAEGHLKLVFLV